MFVDIHCPIRVECILSCSTTSAFCTANTARGYILAEFSHSLTDFRANLSSLIKETMSTTMHLFTFYLESDGMSTNNDYKHFFGALSLQLC